jgi:hypothetical protein
MPVLARIPWSTNAASATAIADPTVHNLALPTSLLWTGRQ